MRYSQRIALLLGLCLSIGTTRTSADDSAQASADDAAPVSALETGQTLPDGVPDGIDVLFLTQDRPLILRFVVTANGRPLESSLDSLVDRLFAVLDKDGNGQLDATERRWIPSRRALQQLQMIPQTSVSTSLLQSDPRNSIVTRANLHAYLEKLGLQTFRLSSAGASGTSPNVVVSTPAGLVIDAASTNIGQQLFGILDTNRDGALSQEELEAAETVLRKVDLDRNELFTAQEFQVLAADSPSAASSAGTLDRRAPGLVRYHLLTGQSPAQLQLTARACGAYYAHAAAGSSGFSGSLARNQSKLPTDIFDQIDRDGDGVIDAADWLAALSSPSPDLLVSVWLGKDASSRMAEERLIVQDVGALGLQPSPPVPQGGRDVDLSGDRLQFRFADNQQFREPADLLKDLFSRLDRDNNGYIDRNEAGQLRGLDFRDLDTDGDGMVFLKEFQAGGLPLCTLVNQLVDLNIAETGFDMFSVADANKDGRLSIREVRSLPSLFVSWDRNGDGRVDAAELPAYFMMRLNFGLALEAFSQDRSTPQVVQTRQFNPNRTSPQPADASIPPWFTLMDRNGDGDVSRREFLGDLKLFDLWDTDGDGLLSPAEARAIPRKQK